MSIAIPIVYGLAAIAIPVALYFVFVKRFDLKAKPFIIGGVTFFVFSIILEGSINATVSMFFPSAFQNVWFYAIYGGLMAGFFEEAGRFIMMKLALKDELDDNRRALSFGAGHGGVEALLVLLGGLANIATAITLTQSGEIPAGSEAAVAQILESATVPIAILAVVERLFAVSMHISLSVLVWFAVKKDDYRLFGLAILLHAVFDSVMVLINNFFGIWATNALLLLACAAAAYCAYRLWKKESAAAWQ